MIRPSSVRFVLKLTQQSSQGQRPGAPARAFVLAVAATLAGSGANGAGMAKRLRGPLWGRMSPQAAAEHLWARKGSGAFGFAREREASALTGDIARFWSKVREALDRLDANTTTDAVDLVGSARCFTHRA